ncbi:hypothetical protein [Gluconacetobacter liquefaciens]
MGVDPLLDLGPCPGEGSGNVLTVPPVWASVGAHELVGPGPGGDGRPVHSHDAGSAGQAGRHAALHVGSRLGLRCWSAAWHGSRSVV